MQTDVKIPIIYGWEKEKNYLRVLSMIEGIKREGKVTPFHVYLASQAYEEVKNSFKDNEFLLAREIGGNGEHYDGGHHRAVAYSIMDLYPNFNVIESGGIPMSYSTTHDISEDTQFRNGMNYKVNFARWFVDSVKYDKNYIDVFEIKDYIPIIEHMDFVDKMNIKDFKELVRTYIQF